MRSFALKPIWIASFLISFVIAFAGLARAQDSGSMTGETVYTGEWVKKTRSINGTWQIVQEGDRLFIDFDDDFKTSKAPDLKVFLSPLMTGELKNGNAVDGSLFIAPLDNNKGAQRYEIPEGTDLSKFKSLIIHCEAYTKLWGGGDFTS